MQTAWGMSMFLVVTLMAGTATADPVAAPSTTNKTEQHDALPADYLKLVAGDDDAVLRARLRERRDYWWIDVSGSLVTAGGLESITRLPRMKRVSLDAEQLGAASAELLAFLQGLELLEVRGATDASMERLGPLRKLRRLGVGYSNISDAGLAHVASMRGLESLSLINCLELTDAGLLHLAGLNELRELDLNHTGITDAGLRHLAGLSRLERLDLARNPITDEGLVHLRGLTALRELQIGHTRVTDAGMSHLKPLRELQHLGVYRLPITDAGLKPLSELTRLTTLGAKGTRVTEAGRGQAPRDTSSRAC